MGTITKLVRSGKGFVPKQVTLTPAEEAENERLIGIAERTNASSRMEKAILVKELLMKAEGGMFPTPDDAEPPKISTAPAPGVKAPPGYEAKEVIVHRGGKTFKSTRFFKVGGVPKEKAGHVKPGDAGTAAWWKEAEKPKEEP